MPKRPQVTVVGPEEFQDFLFSLLQAAQEEPEEVSDPVCNLSVEDRLNRIEAHLGLCTQACSDDPEPEDEEAYYAMLRALLGVTNEES